MGGDKSPVLAKFSYKRVTDCLKEPMSVLYILINYYTWTNWALFALGKYDILAI